MNKLEQEVFIWDVWVTCFGLYLEAYWADWHVFVSGKSYMDYIFWMGNGTWKPDSWLYMVYYDSWNSVWKAVFQDGKTFFHAIWCQCDRVEYKNLRSHLRE